MAKITKAFKLNKTQAEIDFVDINPQKDLPLFLDPHFIAHRYDAWSQSATTYIRTFFQYLVDLINRDQIDLAKEIFSYLTEPNETCLGLSKAGPKGRSVNKSDIDAIFLNLVNSQAVQQGLVEELQDAMIFVDGVGKDKLSDITTNVIREKLIEYTQTQCNLWNIPLTTNVPSGFYWSAKNKRWESKQTEMLMLGDKKILLVPKSIVSFCENYTPGVYHRFFVLNFLQHEHLRLRTSLVKTRENKKKKTVTYYVTKTDLQEKVSPGDKPDLRKFTSEYPEVFKKFKADKNHPSKSIHNNQIAKIDMAAVADHLISELSTLVPGNDTAHEYETLIQGILEILLYPDLTCPQKQVNIHQGRKRVDITFDNAAYTGSFFEFHQIHKIPCQYIMIECKNYSKDPNNPELDQLAGRFGVNRGQVGLLVFRSVSKMSELVQRCMDTYKDGRGLIIPLSDKDLIEGLQRIKTVSRPLDDLLRERSRKIQMG